MKRIGLAIIAAAGLMSTGLMGTAAQAQGVGVEIGAPGVRVEGGYRDRDDWGHDRRWRRSYNTYRDHDRGDAVVIRRHRDRDWDRPRRKVIIERDY